MKEKNNLFPTPGLHNAIRNFNLLLTASKKSQSCDHILIRGPRGTGKSYFLQLALEALEISSPPVRVNCAAISPDLADSELFGYVKGAFSDAVKDTPGFIKVAKKSGLIILEEFNSLSHYLQAKLLVFMEQFFYYSVGGREPENAAVRIIATANQENETNLRRDVEDRFKIFVEISPLYLRRNDILYFIGKKYPELTLSAGIILLLYNYHWPGNMRELDRALFELSSGVRHQYEPTWLDFNIVFTELSEKIKKCYEEKPEILQVKWEELDFATEDFSKGFRYKIRLADDVPGLPIENILSSDGNMVVADSHDCYPVPVLDVYNESERRVAMLESRRIQQFFQFAYGHNAIISPKPIHEQGKTSISGETETALSPEAIADYLIRNNKSFPLVMRAIIDRIGHGGQAGLKRILGVSAKTVSTWVKNGVIPDK